jgi:hypothetical protein
MANQTRTASADPTAAENEDQELDALSERRRAAETRIEALKDEMRSAEAERRAAAWAIDSYLSRQATQRQNRGMR